MFSNDKNIETISQLIEIIKHYIGLQTKYAKLDVIEKIVRLLTATAIVIVLSVFLMFALIYASFAIAYALATVTGTAAAFCIVAGLYLCAFALCIIFKKQWIERPLVRFFAGILMQE
ncbi:MAG: phage holin family protein [Prevotella sp.]